MSKDLDILQTSFSYVTMLDEPHYPSKWTVATVFFVLLLMMAGVFAWAFYFNLSSLVLRLEHPAVVMVNGESIPCEALVCQTKQVPGEYLIQAEADGYYPYSQSLLLERFQEQEVSIDFDIVPYLAPYTDPLPENDSSEYRLQRSADETLLVDLQNTSVARFESLQDPSLQVENDLAVVLDQGRIFFVDLKTGKRQRRFNDEVEVQSAFLNPYDAVETLLFVRSDDADQRWLYEYASNTLQPLLIELTPELFVWRADLPDTAFLISSAVLGSQEDSFVEDLFDLASTEDSTLKLYQYDFGTESATLLLEFQGSILPRQLLRRDARYFLQFSDDSWQELIVSEDL